MFYWPLIGSAVSAVVQLCVKNNHLLELIAAINGVVCEIVSVEMGDSVYAWRIKTGDGGRVEEEAVVSAQ